ncbi:MAG: repeat protein, partial [Verrucomicrobiales bacterium]|nr:repeat protein [Verrucomicrobiales bacterium]
DSFGAGITNGFNNQGLLIASSNAFGRVHASTFDVLDRVTNSVDANGVSVATTYDNLNRILGRSYPDTGVESWGYTLNFAGASTYTNQVGNVVTYGYDAMSRLTNQVNIGIRTNQFVYSGAGDLTTLVDGNSHSTIWGYDLFGRNTNKVDATSATILAFKYDANDRMTNRTSAAKGTTTYSYDNEGNLRTISYPTSSSITFSYDAINRMTNMTDGVGTSKFTYTAAGQLQSEDGPWSSDTVAYSYNNRLRSSFTLQQPIGASLSQTYGYDAARRLKTIASTAGTFTYSYDPTRNLQIQKLALPNSSYITNAYDSVSRLTDTWLKNSGGTILNYHGYTINQANQRTRQTRFNNDYVDYTYDNAGQLKTANGKESGGTPLRYNEQLGYSYDPAGNLQFRTNNTLVQNFVVNSLNELGNATSSGAITVEGTTTSTASSVTVNGTSASLYADATFAATNMSLSSSYTAIAQDSLGRKDTNTVTLNLSTNVSFQYDANGNLTNDSLRIFQYDDENQLTSVWATNAWKSDFAYDGLRRRRAETNYLWNSSLSQFVKSSERRFVYDGNLVIEERDANNRSQVYYTRGRDLSGTLAHAGGIGGMLARTPTTDYMTSSSAAHAFYFSDGNGNITTLTSTNQLVLAKYLYDSFGNTLSKSGPLADLNLYRFSSKELHLNSGLIYFARRFYDPNLQRWLNNDPIAEWGGFNLSRYVENDPVNKADRWGLEITYFYGNQVSSPLYPTGGIPYLTGDTVLENLAAGAYNLVPTINNGIGKVFEPVNYFINATGDYVADRVGDRELGEGVKRAGTLLLFLDGKPPCNKVEFYALKATKPGFYPVMRRGFAEPQAGVWLEAGDAWKYGTTKNPDTRYSQVFLDEWDLRYQTISSGTLQESLSAEKQALIGYRASNGQLPPGNKIVR